MTEIDATLVEEALKIVNGARRERYDRPERNFERIALVWQALTDRPYTAHEVALMFVGLKIVRDAYSPQRDNKVDGIGYLLCADAVEQKPSEAFPEEQFTAEPEEIKVNWSAYMDFAIEDATKDQPIEEPCTVQNCFLVGPHERDDYCPAPVPARGAAPRDIPEYVPNCDDRCRCQDKRKVYCKVPWAAEHNQWCYDANDPRWQTD